LAVSATKVTDLPLITGKTSFTTTYLIYTLTVEFAVELQASLQEFTASGIVEVRENGGSVAPFSGMSWEVRGDGEKPLLHLWSEQLNARDGFTGDGERFPHPFFLPQILCTRQLARR
jgi:hypothetical protein